VRSLRYDQLHAKGVVPVPHVVKIDFQGCEYEVLEGFGELLDQVLGIEL
jgi:FkbM family methyltransferase